MNNGTNWKEEYLNEEGKWENGSNEKEQIFFDQIATQIRDVVNHFKEDNHGIPARASHAKILAGFTDAIFRVLPAQEFPMDLSAGFLIPGKEYGAVIRLSNTSSEIADDDAKPDLRGFALRIKTEKGDHDFIMNNAEVHHARDAREAMITIRAGVEKDIIANKIPDIFPLEDEIAGFLGALPFLVKHLGFNTARHIVGTLKKQMKIKIESLSTETFWSRAPLAIGKVMSPEQAIAVKYRLRPAISKTEPDKIKQGEPDLAQKLEHELSNGDIKFYFEVQRFKDPDNTPIEDGTKSWGDDSSFKPIAELFIPQKSKNEKKWVDALAFNPWNIDEANFKPLGSLNRSRRKVYAASFGERQK